MLKTLFQRNRNSSDTTDKVNNNQSEKAPHPVLTSGSQPEADLDATPTTEKPSPAVEENGFSGGEKPSPAAQQAAPVPLSNVALLKSVKFEPRPDGSVLYSLNGKPAFVDHGSHVLMEKSASSDKDAVRVALLHAIERFKGVIELTGSDEFKRQALNIMIEHGISATFKNPSQELLYKDIIKEKATQAQKAALTEENGIKAELADLAAPPTLAETLKQPVAANTLSAAPESAPLSPVAVETVSPATAKKPRSKKAPPKVVATLPVSLLTLSPDNKTGSEGMGVALAKVLPNALQGTITLKGKIRNVVVYSETRRDAGPDNSKKFMKVMEVSHDASTGEKTFREIGHANAMNQRKDQKPVYFDEVIFKIGEDTLCARLTAPVSSATRDMLGFTQPLKARPSAEDSIEAPAPEAVRPTRKAPRPSQAAMPAA